ncbi:phytoene/squalene synthase family protein [Actinomadura fibrosa]|uniref:Phytoene/squalene synthase family protein n=1 Tax=Actinomadura fibrosa TaxID=111802 RepID=A0ABW2XUV3_9ACTN|nr:squalene/phytoene synthase family protein [Actinomadura fibrosa]
MRTSWQRVLDAAGLDGGLRADYTAAGRMMARRYPDFYSAIRLLLPAARQPPLLAVCALGIRGDELADEPAHRRDPVRFHSWADQVRAGLVTGGSDQPHIRAFLHAADRCGIAHADVRAHLAGQAERLLITEYATEQDHDDHIDRVVLPMGRMMVPVFSADAARHRAVLRPAMDAGQRTDDLVDLHADLRGGLLTVPRTELLRFGVTREDLLAARDTPAVRALVAHRCARARAVLRTATAAAGRLDAGDRRLWELTLLYFGHLLDAVERRGAALDRHPLRYVRASPVPLLRAAWRVMHASRQVPPADTAT